MPTGIHQLPAVTWANSRKTSTMKKLSLMITAALAAVISLPARAADAVSAAVEYVSEAAADLTLRFGTVLGASVPTGTTFFVATAFGTSLPTSGASNATECVLSMASTTGLSVGDYVEVTSGWGRLNLRTARLKAVVANTSVTLEGMDTTSTTYFPTGTGVGSVRKVTTWQEITQVTQISSSGGDPKKVTYKYLASDVEYQINDGFAATDYTLTLDADSIGTAGYTAMRSLTDVQTNTVLRINKRSGAITLQPCTVALNEADQMSDGQITTVTASFSGNNRQTKYAS